MADLWFGGERDGKQRVKKLTAEADADRVAAQIGHRPLLSRFVKRLRRLLQKVIGVFRQWRHRRRKRRDDKQERKVAARENMRWPTRNDVPTDGPNIGL